MLVAVRIILHLFFLDRGLGLFEREHDLAVFCLGSRQNADFEGVERAPGIAV